MVEAEARVEFSSPSLNRQGFCRLIHIKNFQAIVMVYPSTCAGAHCTCRWSPLNFRGEEYLISHCKSPSTRLKVNREKILCHCDMRLDWFSSTVKVPYNQFPDSYCRRLPFFPDATILFSLVQKNSINVQKTVYLTLFLQPPEKKTMGFVVPKI